MGKVMGLLFMVVAIWVALEVYTEGVDGAFNGLFTRMPGVSVSQAQPRPSTSQRAADAYRSAHDSSEQRIDRMLED